MGTWRNFFLITCLALRCVLFGKRDIDIMLFIWKTRATGMQCYFFSRLEILYITSMFLPVLRRPESIKCFGEYIISRLLPIPVSELRYGRYGHGDASVAQGRGCRS